MLWKCYVRRQRGQIGRKRTYVITGGKKEVWASSVVYVIARLNFLFDRGNQHCLRPDEICGFFGAKKTTTSAKAAEIEKAGRIPMGHVGLCSPELSDSLSYGQLSNGIILIKKMANEMGFL